MNSGDPSIGLNLSAPVASIGDKVHAVTKAVISDLLPFGGATAAEIFHRIISPPLQRRSAQWMEEVSHAVNWLMENRGLTEAELIDNQAFTDTVIQATRVAASSASNEKLERLRNAIINSATKDVPVDGLRNHFMRLVEVLSVCDIQVLNFLYDIRDRHKQYGIGMPVGYRDKAVTKVILENVPSLANNGFLLSMTIRHLQDESLVSNISNYNTIVKPYHRGLCSAYGQAFIQFVTIPQES